MRIAFDIDGVLADFSTACIAHIRERFLPDLPADYQHIRWSFVDLPLNWTEVFTDLLRTENLWLKLPPFKEEVDALRTYIEMHGDDEIFYLTARPASAGASTHIQTQLWLNELGLGPLGANVLVTSDRSSWANKPSDKAAFMAEYGISRLIDDFAPTVRDCNAKSIYNLNQRKAFLLDRLYNQDATDVPRVYSVAEFLLEVESHES